MLKIINPFKIFRSKPIFKVIIISLLWSILINPGTLNGDTILRWKMANAFWTEKEEVIVQSDYKPKTRELGLGVLGRDGKRHIAYDFGQSLLMLPGDWLGTKIHFLFPKLASGAEPQLVEWLTINFLIFIPLNVAVAVSCFWLLRVFDFNNHIAALSSIAWFLGTTVLLYAQLPQQNNQVLLFVIIGYASIIAFIKSNKYNWIVLSAFSLGFAFLIRFTSIIHVLTVVIFLLSSVAYKNRNLIKVIQSGLLWIVGFIPLAFIAKYIDYTRFGFWSLTSAAVVAKKLVPDPLYAHISPEPPGFPFTNPPHVGIIGVLFSLEKSIFIYDPLLLPCLILGALYWKKISPYIRLYLISCIFNLVLHIVLTSKLIFWHGDGAWGARYQVTSVHLLLIPLVAIFTRKLLSSIGWKKLGLRIILTLAIMVQIASVTLIYYTETNHRFRLAKRIENLICLVDQSPSESFLCQLNHQEKQSLKKTFAPLPFNYARFGFNRKLIFLIWGSILILTVLTTTAWFFQLI